MISIPDLAFEKHLWRSGLANVGGMDEAGRGALAGPVTVGLVILERISRLSLKLKGVRDSKQMTPLQREYWAGVIREVAHAWSLGGASAAEIDSLGISAAVRLAAERALEALPSPPRSPADRLPPQPRHRHPPDLARQRRPEVPEHRGCLRARQDRSRRVDVRTGHTVSRLRAGKAQGLWDGRSSRRA